MDIENQKWLKKFKKKYGRAPKVLHIGNIANNASNNAKILNEIGLENDVICYNYYHIMGCPEWEDADFEGVIGDDFNPDWSAVDLRGYKRPEWFIQGPQELCLEYLETKHSLNRKLDRVSVLEKFVKYCTLMNKDKPLIGFYSFLEKRKAHLSKQLSIANRYRIPTEVKTQVRIIINSKTYKFMSTLPKRVFNKAKAIINRSILRVQRLKFYQQFFGQPEEDRIFEKLVLLWQNAFPYREDCLEKNDVLPYMPARQKWNNVLRSYDFVIGYSTDPFIPLLCQVPYFAFEHGTIRDIPYNADGQGRRTALAYNQADHVFVTNLDCVPSADKLAPQRYTFINHPYDEDRGLSVSGFEELRANLLQKLDCDFLFFFPTRQDWVAGTGFADKANDVFLLALADLRKMGIKVGAVCCEWGANVNQSKELIHREGLTPHIEWFKPLPIVKFERMARASDLVVDQFKLGAFGGVFFKAMAVGAPVLTYLNEAMALDVYGEFPPIVNCKTREEIVKHVSLLFKNPNELKELGIKARVWIKKYHGKNNTVNLQLKQFRIAFENRKKA